MSSTSAPASASKLALLIFASAVPALPFFFGAHPLHDTFLLYQHFAYTYSTFDQFGEFPAWNPYLVLGQAVSGVDMIANGPSQYFVMFLGKVFSIRNDLALYVLSLVLYNSLYIAGLMLLAAAFHATWAETVFLCLAAGASGIWLVQFDFNFFIHALLPFLFWSVYQLINKPRVDRLIYLAAFVAAFGLYGRTYTAIIIFYVTVLWGLICLFLRWRGPKIRRDKDPPSLWPAATAAALGTLAISAIFLIRTLDIFANSFIRTWQRGNSGEVPLDSFLNYGDQNDFSKWLALVTLEQPTHNFDLYTGAIPILCVLAGLIWIPRMPREDRQWFLSFLGVCLAVILFTSTQHSLLPLTEWAYYLPGMNMVRHTGYFGTITKFLLLAAAVISLRMLKHKSLRLLIMALIVFDLGVHTLLQLRSDTYVGAFHDRTTGDPPVSIFRASPRKFDFNNVRILPEEYPDLDKFAVENKQLSRYGSDPAFLKIDLCARAGRYDQVSKGVADLLSLLNREAVGCIPPKLLLVRTPLFAANELEAKRMLAQNITLMEKSAVLIHPPQPVDSTPLPPSTQFQIKEFSPNQLRMDISAGSSIGQWLVYADGYHPWWEASVDGKPTGIVLANLAFKAVEVPPGAHEVEFRIKTWPRLMFQVQAAILALAQVFFTIGVWREIRR